MPFRRRTRLRRRRPVRRARRPATRRTYRRRYSTRTYSFKRVASQIPFIGSGGSRTLTQTSGTQNLAAEFMLSNLPNYTEFTSLYDQYKITKIVCKMIPMTTCNSFVNQTASPGDVQDTPQNPGMLMSVLDFDDASPLALIGDYLQYQNMKQQPVVSRRSHVRVFTPRVRKNLLNAGGGSVPGTIGKSGWIDCSYDSIPHYGLKVYLDPRVSSIYQQTYQLFTTFYVKFRNVR